MAETYMLAGEPAPTDRDPELITYARPWWPLPTDIHEPDVGQPCVHLLDDMPTTIAVSRAAVERLNFQPRITAGPQPVIAARRGDILIVAVHMIGATATRHRQRGSKTPIRQLVHRWHFQLTEVTYSPDTLLAVLR